MANGYVVVFRYTDAAKHYKGVITWSRFPSYETFLDEQEKGWPKQEIVAEGIAVEEAIALTRATPLECRIRAAVGESCDEDGKVIPEMLEMRILRLVCYIEMTQTEVLHT